MSSLKALRMKRNLSQEQLAKLSDMSLGTIRAYEQGQKSIDEAKYKTLLRISSVLDVPFWVLFEDDELSHLAADNATVVTSV